MTSKKGLARALIAAGSMTSLNRVATLQSNQRNFPRAAPHRLSLILSSGTLSPGY
jgi:hypothetical protein